MKILISLLLLATLAYSQTEVQVESKSRSFKDSFGRQVIFHGVNMVPKVAPYLPTNNGFTVEDSLTDKDIDDLVKWGFNFVRLGVMWEAVERTPK